MELDRWDGAQGHKSQTNEPNIGRERDMARGGWRGGTSVRERQDTVELAFCCCCGYSLLRQFLSKIESCTHSIVFQSILAEIPGRCPGTYSVPRSRRALLGPVPDVDLPKSAVPPSRSVPTFARTCALCTHPKPQSRESQTHMIPYL